MSDYTLYLNNESGNSYKAALVLQLCGTKWTPKPVDLAGGEQAGDAFRAMNEMGEVPVLVDHTEGDIALTQSGVILYHLCERFTQFAPKTKWEDREVLRWILFDNHKLTGMLTRYRLFARFFRTPDIAEARYCYGNMVKALKTLDRRLDGREWVAANHCTIADLSLCGYLFWPEQADITLSDYPNIKSWLERINALPNYAPPEDILPAAA